MTHIWKRSSVFSNSYPIERYCYAGLSHDGKLCFLTDSDEQFAVVFDTNSLNYVWKQQYPEEYTGVSLADRIVGEYIELDDPVVGGKYRLFGVEGCNFPRTSSVKHNTKIAVDVGKNEVILTTSDKKTERQRLQYEAFSGDEWASATFSDDESTIAVFDSYNITFFR